MNLTPLQQSILLALNAEWQSPAQIASRLPVAPGNLSEVNQALKDLLREGLVQANPIVFGMYLLNN